MCMVISFHGLILKEQKDTLDKVGTGSEKIISFLGKSSFQFNNLKLEYDGEIDSSGQACGIGSASELKLDPYAPLARQTIRTRHDDIH